MARRYGARSRSMGKRSSGLTPVRVIVIGGGARTVGLRTQVARMLREGFDGECSTDRDTLEQVLSRPTGPISHLLFIADRTVKWHATAIYRKLEVMNRTEAVAVALRWGLVDLDAIAVPPDRAA